MYTCAHPRLSRTLQDAEDDASFSAAWASQAGEERGARPPGESSKDTFPSVWAAFLRDLISPAVMQGLDSLTPRSPAHPVSECPLQRGLQGPWEQRPLWVTGTTAVDKPAAGPRVEATPTMPKAQAHLRSAGSCEDAAV